MSQKGSELARTDLDMKTLGPALIDQARKAEQEAAQKLVVDGVRTLLSDINKQKQIIKAAEQKIEKQQRRLEALNNGEFSVGVSSDYNTPQIKFNDSDLNSL